MTFQLHPALERKTIIGHLPLCTLFLEDEANYPWLILVPRRPALSNLMQVPQEDQGQLLRELSLAQAVLTDLFHPTQLNVAAIGNKTPQLHIHVIARSSTDPAWPQTVWDHPARAKYPSEQKEQLVKTLREKFSDFSCFSLSL
jgi:diadenosine tetraphosphate (Ap4A) HIT family hydrolase